MIPCSYVKCGEFNLRPMLEAFRCSLCDKLYCLVHRNPEEHDCITLLQQEDNRQNTNNKHIEIIQRLLPNSDKPVGEFSTSKKQSSANENKVTLERIKLRMRCTGDQSIAVYNRIHVRIMLAPGIERRDVISNHNTLQYKILPSQRRSNFNKTPTSDIYVWLDKTKSIGWHIDFIVSFFKIVLVQSEYINQSPQYALASCKDNLSNLALQDNYNNTSFNEHHVFAYSDIIESVIKDGDANLCLMNLSGFKKK